ncbi:hypothetical protein Tco_1182009 [Tanacetum coccineum]
MMLRKKGKAIMKDKKQELTGIKEVDDLEQRIKNLEAIFSKLRDIKLKQKVNATRARVNARVFILLEILLCFIVHALFLTPRETYLRFLTLPVRSKVLLVKRLLRLSSLPTCVLRSWTFGLD